ncbi:MAG: hypothetical protein DRQ51_06495 [Gammaproteobacteria bacterium]|nr:MAG: hypothetical protein DRQ51_06495 [Gammaproteobacteria bacterium]
MCLPFGGFWFCKILFYVVLKNQLYPFYGFEIYDFGVLIYPFQGVKIYDFGGLVFLLVYHHTTSSLYSVISPAIFFNYAFPLLKSGNESKNKNFHF